MFWLAPRPRRIRLFDAVTAYNMYDWPRTQFRGYARDSAFFPEVRAAYRQYKLAALEAGAAFVPSVLPGYNDRAVRLVEDHYVIPRRLSPEAEEGTVFARALAGLGLAFLNDRSPLLMITTFNEWHEWSQIEPTRPGPVTTRDVTGEGYTTGFPHQGYGLRYLELLREAVVAVSGRVVLAGGRQPAPGVEVRAIREGKAVAAVRADSTGHFRIARGLLERGRYELVPGRRGKARTVEVGRGWSGPVELEVE